MLNSGYEMPILGIGTYAHKKTSAQVLIRWHLQDNNIAIPGSSNPDHILENYQIFDFELTPDDMTKKKALDKNKRFANY